MFPIPAGVQTLIWLNVATFVVDAFLLDGRLRNELALYPVGAHEDGTPGFLPWQLVSYAFLHANFLHIFFNMFGLAMFGGDVERVWGRARFLVYYFVCVLAAGLVQEVFSWAVGSDAPTVGASGGLFGVLLAFAVLFPQRRIIFLLLPIPLPAWLFVTLYGLAELYMGVTGTEAGVAHFAHLGGLVGGWLMIRYGNALSSRR
jgi:membrane associated rhomboid family serine protease